MESRFDQPTTVPCVRLAGLLLPVLLLAGCSSSPSAPDEPNRVLLHGCWNQAGEAVSIYLSTMGTDGRQQGEASLNLSSGFHGPCPTSSIDCKSNLDYLTGLVFVKTMVQPTNLDQSQEAREIHLPCGAATNITIDGARWIHFAAAGP